ncbi:hypothetical protein HERIO_2228 [Hepatospora eriocheir]|uniref:Uncharacterized protein n=1 Tax=Hepatospora eriocheir TaxID=1081669 RepID=A0A1X0Q7R2_9MICR|nr:hypothetical protein HERIO_2228 [Hepatospora eriocheir]
MRFNEKYLNPSIKYKGKCLMLRDCFSYKGVGKIEMIKFKMTTMLYTQFLNKNSCLSIKIWTWVTILSYNMIII